MNNHLCNARELMDVRYPKPGTTTWLNINNHVCNAWETMDSRYRNPIPQRGWIWITMYAMHGKQWIAIIATPREVEYYHIPNQFIPWLFNPLQDYGRIYYPIPWVATHGYSHLTTLWLWVVGIMAVHHFPCIAYMVIYIQPRCGYILLEY